MMESTYMICCGRPALPSSKYLSGSDFCSDTRWNTRSFFQVNSGSSGAGNIIRRRHGVKLCNHNDSRNGWILRGVDNRHSLPPNVELENAQVQDGNNMENEKALKAVSNNNDEISRDELDVAAGPNAFWDRFPQRYKLIVTTSLAFVVCNMDKVNMSVAIIPMSHQLGWSASTAGLVQSSFFWGYALSQLPGGFLAGKYSGKKVLRAGVLAWSIATAVVPLTASYLPGLFFCRLLVGLGEGVSPSAATDLIARTMPIQERARAVSFVFGGLNVGSVVGLLLAPAIIKLFGWQVVFYLFGIIGIVWCFTFDTAATEKGASGAPASSKRLAGTGNPYENGSALKLTSLSTAKKEAVKADSDLHAASFDISDKAIPWKAFFKEPALWAMMYAHFCGNWGHYNLLSWFPTYFSEELSLDLTNAALVSILPPLGSVVVSGIASSLADSLISKGADTTKVRKLCQSIAFLSPAVCMGIASFCPGLPPWVIAVILTLGSSLSTFTLAGLYCTHQDISPKYASILLGITNTVGAVPGILGVALTGYILDQTKSWTLALFAPCIFFYVTGAIVWNVYASSKPKDF